jgi:hypothetical protein
VSLSLLADQMKHDEWFELESAEPADLRQSEATGSIHLVL